MPFGWFCVSHDPRSFVLAESDGTANVCSNVLAVVTRTPSGRWQWSAPVDEETSLSLGVGTPRGEEPTMQAAKIAAETFVIRYDENSPH